MSQIILLSDCVAYVESRNNPLAMRYEPTYQFNPANIDKAIAHATGGWIDTDTAAMILSTSWGAYQIMGDNLYTLGYQGTIAEFLTTEALQLDYFNRFIQSIGFSNAAFSSMDGQELDNFAMRYNGSPVYANSLQKAYQALQME